VLSGRVAELRAVYLPPDPASRTSYVAGRSPSATSGFPTSRYRWGLGSPVPRRCYRC
jgi:hypothetical protein